MADNSTHIARCFCGAVELGLSGAPAAMGYCHCASCRQWSAGPVNAFSLWPVNAVGINRGGTSWETMPKARRACADGVRNVGGTC